MSNLVRNFLIFLFVVGTAGIVYWELHGKLPAPAPEAAPPPPAASSKDTPKYPVDGEEAPEPAAPATAAREASPPPPPAATFEDAVLGLLGKSADLLETEELIRRIVVTVANENSSVMPPDLLPWKKVPGSLVTDSSGGQLTLSGENSARYRAAMAAFESVSAEAIVAVYHRFYPRFQKMYDELGTKGYFNDRLVEAIDDALAAPTPAGPVALEQKTLRYHFADPELEGLSAGQKLLVRIGPADAARVKKKLERIRALVTKHRRAR